MTHDTTRAKCDCGYKEGVSAFHLTACASARKPSPTPNAAGTARACECGHLTDDHKFSGPDEGGNYEPEGCIYCGCPAPHASQTSAPGGEAGATARVKLPLEADNADSPVWCIFDADGNLLCEMSGYTDLMKECNRLSNCGHQDRATAVYEGRNEAIIHDGKLAALIVEAVNAYEGLKAERDALKEFLETLTTDCPGDNYESHDLMVACAHSLRDRLYPLCAECIHRHEGRTCNALLGDGHDSPFRCSCSKQPTVSQ